MAGAIKTNGVAKTPRSKSRIITFKVSANMRAKVDANFPPSSPSPPPAVKAEPTAFATPQPISASINSPAENASPSSGTTPLPTGADDAVAMPPPSEPVVKKGKGGAKRKAETTIDGLPKPRGKPGPKKRKLEDGTIDPSAATKPAPKLGPKANQGAINAGLRALDRGGPPCRKWSKGKFTLKTFTGTVWEIPRWTAPPKVKINGQSAGSPSGSSGKENKDNSQVGSEPSNGGLPAADASSIVIPPSSPVPQAASVVPPSSAVSASA